MFSFIKILSSSKYYILLISIFMNFSSTYFFFIYHYLFLFILTLFYIRCHILYLSIRFGHFKLFNFVNLFAWLLCFTFSHSNFFHSLFIYFFFYYILFVGFKLFCFSSLFLSFVNYSYHCCCKWLRLHRRQFFSVLMYTS